MFIQAGGSFHKFPSFYSVDVWPSDVFFCQYVIMNLIIFSKVYAIHYTEMRFENKFLYYVIVLFV